jgi:hypothetical protein
MEIFNPLQHIPIVSTIYRRMTGDKIGPMERIAGDTLYGGLLGLASSVANVAFEQITGKDFGDTALAMLGVGRDTPTAVAANATAAQPAALPLTEAPASQFIPIAPDASSPSPAQASSPSAIENKTLVGSLNREGTGLETGSFEPASTTTRASASLTLPTRNGFGLDQNPVASTTASVTPLLATGTRAGALDDANASALKTSLDRDGIRADLGLRAMYAYRKSLAPPADGSNAGTMLH